MVKFTCPNGHTFAVGDKVADVICQPCGLIATWLSRATGEVYTWRTLREYRAACERLQADLDDAFCHQYFD